MAHPRCGYSKAKAAKKEVLLQCIQEEWEKIAMSKVAELVKSMPRVKDFAQGVGR